MTRSWDKLFSALYVDKNCLCMALSSYCVFDFFFNNDGRNPLEFYAFFFFNVYFWERDRVLVGEGQRKRETESELGSRLWAVITEPDQGLELLNHEIMTWGEVRCLTDWATQTPHRILCLKNVQFEINVEGKQIYPPLFN